MKKQQKSHKTLDFTVGQSFNPYRLFTGICIPEALVRSQQISAGAKLAYGRLARYAGQNGLCHPCMHTLGCEIGVGERQTQKYLAELVRNQLIRREPRFGSDRRQTSNSL